MAQTIHNFISNNTKSEQKIQSNDAELRGILNKIKMPTTNIILSHSFWRKALFNNSYKVIRENNNFFNDGIFRKTR